MDKIVQSHDMLIFNIELWHLSVKTSEFRINGDFCYF